MRRFPAFSKMTNAAVRRRISGFAQRTFQTMESFKDMISLSENGSGCSSVLSGVYV